VEVHEAYPPAIGGRAIGTLIKANGLGDAYRSYLAAQLEGVDFSLAAIPAPFTTVKAHVRHRYMNGLYGGYSVAMQAPPGRRNLRASVHEDDSARRLHRR
jgi:hypothetical protein